MENGPTRIFYDIAEIEMKVIKLSENFDTHKKEMESTKYENDQKYADAIFELGQLQGRLDVFDKMLSGAIENGYRRTIF